ncbi:hypothetical protein CTI12_AA170660 [Artemisia annua]|uniref:Uncharacterized protein n=1 Tax=Artemisia annua TaxID=35608 RepID=A0A2U1PBR5_ARTAN|nr:hypothetical protein CTI12_AA170660 [Artemisia annua]
MADSDIGVADSIYVSIHELIDKPEAQIEDKQRTPTIYRVQNILRNVNRLSYNPRVLSIGPFHKKNRNFKRFEANKVSYVRNLFRRLNSPRDEAMKECIKQVLERIDQIKSCYEGGVEEDYQNNTSNKFAEMMVIDGCFILEIIYVSYKKYDSHSFFDINLVSLYVKHDLVLLENQIPFFVLEDLFRCTISLIDPSLSLVTLVLKFLEDINPFSDKKLVDNIPADTNHDHILGLLQKCYQPMGLHDQECLRESKPMDAAETSRPDHEGLRESKVTALLSYSAADLSRAGVKFAPNKNGKSILTMEFKVSRLPFNFFLMGKPTFFMPVLTIEDYTESFFRNLIAYEQFTPATSKHITSYAFAMDCLLDSQEDVHKVIDSKVFINNLGSTKQASNLFNSICKEITVKDFSYESQWIQVDKYYKGFGNIAQSMYFPQLSHTMGEGPFLAGGSMQQGSSQPGVRFNMAGGSQQQGSYNVQGGSQQVPSSTGGSFGMSGGSQSVSLPFHVTEASTTTNNIREPESAVVNVTTTSCVTGTTVAPSVASPVNKRSRDPEDDVYVDNLHSHKRYLTEIMASSLNGLSVGDPLPENLMDSPARSDSMFYLRDELPLQYSPMSEDLDECRYYESNACSPSPSQTDSQPTSPVSPYRFQRHASTFSPGPYPGAPAVTPAQARQRGSDTEGRFPSSPSDICHSADLRRAALLRSVQMRTQPMGSSQFDAPFSPMQEAVQPCQYIKSLDPEIDNECPDHEKSCQVLSMNMKGEDETTD